MGAWIDTDVGFDDIAAVLVMQHRAGGIDGMSLVFGNAPMAQVEKNVAGAASAFNWTFPIHRGRASPVLGRLETAQSILGDHGMPTAGLHLPEVPVVLHVEDAFHSLCQWLETGTNRRILALGPLTNLAAVALARPDLLPGIGEIVWMGGGVTTGNHTASAEFNAFADPEAAAIVFAHDLPIRMVDLDLCRKVLAWPADVAPIRSAGGRNAALIADLLEGFINIAIERGRPAMALYDAIAAVAFVQPDLVTWREARIDIELAGTFTRGRTVVEQRSGRAPFNAAFAADIDVEAARAMILDVLKEEASR
ncbi:nucleoside hydrolase [Rhizobium oryzicola]|uniref:Nucleoside hydrolase n=1 Tax=Rhizobium oryzicola TaxID=1232668 RepID=A0ABT8T0C3_9HYPH|nr:nucleoside hydrolase [Rhizobium oryzicola]MDO1584205.1 nucleoside hydrolase [Rhizobium oryzicola]